jgi:hypothetical protein
MNSRLVTLRFSEDVSSDTGELDEDEAVQPDDSDESAEETTQP